jgi:hypothetical protein
MNTVLANLFIQLAQKSGSWISASNFFDNKHEKHVLSCLRNLDSGDCKHEEFFCDSHTAAHKRNAD